MLSGIKKKIARYCSFGLCAYRKYFVLGLYRKVKESEITINQTLH